MSKFKNNKKTRKNFLTVEVIRVEGKLADFTAVKPAMM